MSKNILYFINLSVKILIFELAPKLIIGSKGWTYLRTYEPTYGHSKLYKQLRCLRSKKKLESLRQNYWIYDRGIIV